MTPKYFLELTLLASIWGASFLLTRVSVGELGPLPLTFLRLGTASLMLLLLMTVYGQWVQLRYYWRHILVIGIISTCLPFVLIAITTLYSSAGFAAILNSFAPIFSAVIGWLWLKEYLSWPAIIGIVLSCVGVLVMVTDTDSISAGFKLLPILTGLGATLLYALTGNYSRKFVHGVSPLVVATGSQCFATLCLAPAALMTWPDQAVSTTVWISVFTLGTLCTGFALLMYFHLLGRIGVANTMLVTYMVPVFAMLWGSIFLQEAITFKMILGAAFILSGITLTTGLLRRRKALLDLQQRTAQAEQQTEDTHSLQQTRDTHS